MKYDFTTIYDRTGKDALAAEVIPVAGAEVDEGFSRLPMWVADMNFATAPAVVEHIKERLKHPLFGYYNASEEYYNSIIRWQETRNQVSGICKEDIGYENGVLGCLASAMHAFTAPGDAILLHSPTYVGFTGTITGSGRRIVLSDLVKDEDGIWRMDYEDMDRKIKEHRIHFCVFWQDGRPFNRPDSIRMNLALPHSLVVEAFDRLARYVFV